MQLKIKEDKFGDRSRPYSAETHFRLHKTDFQIFTIKPEVAMIVIGYTTRCLILADRYAC